LAAPGVTLAQQTIYFPGIPAAPTHAARPPMSEEVRRDLRIAPLVAAGPGPIVADGAVDKGQAFLSVAVKHALTGTLTSPVAAKGWFAGNRKLPAGTPVYGVPMGGPDGVGVVWCAPRYGPAKDHVNHWSAICLPFGDAAHVWIEAHPAMFPAALDWNDATDRNTSPPTVARGPVDFPPMTLSYAFGGQNERGWLIVETRIDWGEGPQVLRSIALPPGSSGETTIKVMGGEFAVRIAPAETGAPLRASIAVRAAPQASAAIGF
jgi:hypothetical protein